MTQRIYFHKQRGERWYLVGEAVDEADVLLKLILPVGGPPSMRPLAKRAAEFAEEFEPLPPDVHVPGGSYEGMLAALTASYDTLFPSAVRRGATLPNENLQPAAQSDPYLGLGLEILEELRAIRQALAKPPVQSAP